MGRWAVLLLLAGTTLPAMAAKTMPVDQFEQLLAAEHGKSDDRVAERISDVTLTERVSPARLAKWEKDFPGNHTRDALMKLADEAAFLEPPVDDVLRDPAPDSETQEKMLALALDYVRTTITRLPNFYAIRETTHFEDNPSQQTVYAGPIGMGSLSRAMRAPVLSMGRNDEKPLHSTGTTKVTVTYRDGQEVHENRAGKEEKEGQPSNGLTTNGEFGPILGVVMGDVMRGQPEWARWERSGGDPVAVFRYSIPEAQSNYLVGIPIGPKLDQVYPAYHGEIAIDPATGAILRLSAIAEMPPPHEMMHTAILVEYAPVEIGDRTYNCPVHGVAFSKVPATGARSEPQGSATVQTELNDVVFTQYHLFRTDARIIGAGDEKGQGNAQGSDSAPVGAPAAPTAAPAAPVAAPAAPVAAPKSSVDAKADGGP